MGLLGSGDLTGTWPAIVSLVIFIVAYALVAGFVRPLVALAAGPDGHISEKVVVHQPGQRTVFAG